MAIAALSKFVANKPVSFSRPCKTKKKRIFEIDFFRGLAVFLMILYHFSYDLSVLSVCTSSVGIFAPVSGVCSVEPGWITAMESLGKDVWYNFVQTGSPLQVLFSASFMFLCGISCTFAKSNYKRGIQLLYIGIIMSIALDVVSLFHPAFEVHIFFGIIQSLAIAILFYALVDHFFPSFIADIVATLTLSLLFAASFGWSVNGSAINLNSIPKPTPVVMSEHFFELLLGFAELGDDYFSPVLCSMVVFLGAAVGKTLYKDKKSVLPANSPTKWATPITWLGRHSLVVYCLHEPASYLFLWVIMSFGGYTLA